jgi:uncharacterized protein YjiS (DUF1127 family)
LFRSSQRRKKEAIMSTLLQERQQPITAPRLWDRVAEQRANPQASARQQPAATAPDCPVEVPRARSRVILGLIVATLREWRRRSVARRELANFDERILRDIGIDPGIVGYEMRRSFWQPLRDWRH